jgi:REP element-mobilizing transposase RayT
MSNEPIGWFLTWTTYGTWLPGDDRGWVLRGRGERPADPVLVRTSAARMTESACRLSPEQRAAVESQIAETRHVRGWTLHAVNCCTNHVHVVLSAPRETAPPSIRETLKAWTTRRLRGMDSARRQWWTERGSLRPLYDHEALAAAILYTRDGQDHRPP